MLISTLWMSLTSLAHGPYKGFSRKVLSDMLLTRLLVEQLYFPQAHIADGQRLSLIGQPGNVVVRGLLMKESTAHQAALLLRCNLRCPWHPLPEGNWKHCQRCSQQHSQPGNTFILEVPSPNFGLSLNSWTLFFCRKERDQNKTTPPFDIQVSILNKIDHVIGIQDGIKIGHKLHWLIRRDFPKRGVCVDPSKSWRCREQKGQNSCMAPSCPRP